MRTPRVAARRLEIDQLVLLWLEPEMDEATFWESDGGLKTLFIKRGLEMGWKRLKSEWAVLEEDSMRRETARRGLVPASH